MLINADFNTRVVVTPGDYRWVTSPQVGVERVMLDRIGGEQARATSIVRYAKDSRFPAHTHPAGEEILVLSGTFSEDGCDYPAGSYLRNPPGSQHQPASAEGALIFVKLRQMRSTEAALVRIDVNDPQRWTSRATREHCPLYSDAFEEVTIQRIRHGERVLEHQVHSAELLVLAGELAEADQRYEPGTWIRLPKGSYPELIAGTDGTSCYVKILH